MKTQRHQGHQAETEWLTADDAKALLGVTTREGVIAMIKRGKLPGARKVSANRTAPWLVPMSAITTHKNYKAPTVKTKRGQSVKTD